MLMSNLAPIRRATRKDIPAMARIVWDWEQETDWMPAGPTQSRIEEMLADAFENREIWVSGVPARGYLSLDPKTDKIGGLYVSERRCGIGKSLIDQVKRGRNTIHLYTHLPNVDAHRFYEREGFVIMEELRPEEQGMPDEYRMERRA